ncbi:MAG TPA: lysophospholipase, partial [Steroidobacteraceae bacterium]|nr:lysophospholipase [Steroidobacteraceae bacterium]
MSLPPFDVEAIPAHPKAALLIVHGLAEYAARYQSIGDEFASHGIATFALDQIGHGTEAKVRTHIESFDLFVDAASDACSTIIAKHPTLPVFVWGHSMGAIVALQLIARAASPVAGLIVSSNSLEVFKRTLNPLNPFFRFASRIAPRVRIPLGLDAAKISHNEAIQRAYKNDPLIPTTASLRLIVEFAKACELARSNAQKIITPTLIVHGERDEIAPATGSQLLFEQLGSADKTLKVYPGLRHEVQNESNADREKFVELLTQ